MDPFDRRKNYLLALPSELRQETAYYLPYQDVITFYESFFNREAFWKRYAQIYGIVRNRLNWFMTVRNHYVHQLEILLDYFPERNWDWPQVLANPALSLEYIRNHFGEDDNICSALGND